MSGPIPSSLPRLAAVGVLFGVLACDPPAPAPRVWPAGTVLALDGEPILESEIDAAADVFAQLEPDLAPPQLSRLGLTNVVLPRIAGIHLAGPAREEAHQRALDLARLLAAGGTLGGPLLDATLVDREGRARDVGFEAWTWASTAELGQWSGPIETVGAYELVRLDGRTPASSARDVGYKLKVCVVPYVDANDPRGAIERQLDRSKLEIVDPKWDDIVPEYWKHRLRGGSRP